MSQQSEREQAVVALLRQLWLGLSAYRLFPGSLDRPGFVAASERIRSAAERALAIGPVDVQIHGEQFLLSESRLPGDESTDRLARACFERRVERLEVRTIPEVRDLDGLYGVLSTPLGDLDASGGAEEMLRVSGVTAFRLGQVGPAPVEGADHVPEDLAEEAPPAEAEIPDAPSLTADLMIEDLPGTSADQAETLFNRLRGVVSSLPAEVPRGIDLHEKLHEVVTDLPDGLRRSLVELLVERVRDDPLAERIIGTMSNAELTRALVDLGRDGRHEPVELARKLAGAGVRHLDIIDLTKALEAGREEAGTILAGLEQLGIDPEDRSYQPASGESVSDVMARYLAATEQDDVRAMEDLVPESEEVRRTGALVALREYLTFEVDLERVGEVLEVWVGEVREAIRNRQERQVEALVAAARGAQAAGGEEERISLFELYMRRVLDGPLLLELVAMEAEVEPSPVPSLLAPFGDTAVEALLDLLAEEEDRSRRALLLGLLRRIAPGRHGPVAARLSDPRWYVVRNAVNILRSTGGVEVLEPLALAARHDATAVRREAIWGMVAVGGADAIPFLLHLSADPDEEVRGLAVDALGGLVVPEAVAALGGIARTSPDTAVRRRAIDQLAAHPSPMVAEVLQDLASRRSRPRLPRALRRHVRAVMRQKAEARR